ncbi:MAG: diguanylate cyclase, partial [Firmicutes bacterium]|nr:diguanylate cyclase [Bacillota bacterium]
VILMANADLEKGVAACNLVLDSVRKLNIPHSSSDAADHITVSLGLNVVVPADDDILQSFINKADIALYMAKKSGRNRFAVADGLVDGGMIDGVVGGMVGGAADGAVGGDAVVGGGIGGGAAADIEASRAEAAVKSAADTAAATTLDLDTEADKD